MKACGRTLSAILIAGMAGTAEASLCGKLREAVTIGDIARDVFRTVAEVHLSTTGADEFSPGGPMSLSLEAASRAYSEASSEAVATAQVLAERHGTSEGATLQRVSDIHKQVVGSMHEVIGGGSRTPKAKPTQIRFADALEATRLAYAKTVHAAHCN